jgi:hypothetical protein
MTVSKTTLFPVLTVFVEDRRALNPTIGIRNLSAEKQDTEVNTVQKLFFVAN